MDTLDPRLFFMLFHAFLRADSSAEEQDRSAAVLTWLGENIGTVGRVCEPSQRNLLGCVWQHWRGFNAAPSLTILEQLVRQKDKPDAMLDLLVEYKDHKDDLAAYDAADMPAILANRKTDWEKGMLHDALEMAMRINRGSIAGRTAKDPPLSGSDDSVAYFLEMREKMEFINQDARGGYLKDLALDVADRHDERSRGRSKPPIETSFEEIDRIIEGMRPQTVTGVLGFAGQRKSAIVRTIAYRAALAGHRVLHLSLEWSVEEEVDRYVVMHSQDARFGECKERVTIADVERGSLSAEAGSLLAAAAEDLAACCGENLIVKHPLDQTWVAIKQQIDVALARGPLDLVVIDYLAFADVSGKSDANRAIADMIQDAKRFALARDKGEGFAILTPIQGSRKGYADAAGNGGAWTKDGIYQHSEFERTCDLIIYAFQYPELQHRDQIKMGTCKSRRSADVPVTTFAVCPHSGMVSSIQIFSGLETDMREIL